MRILKAMALAAVVLASPAVAAERASDAEEFKGYIEVCAGNTDERGVDGCIADQVDSKVSYLGDILSETAEGLTKKQEKLLYAAEAAFDAYRKAACTYHLSVAASLDKRAQMFCVLRLTNQRIAEVLEGVDFLAHE